MFFGDESKAVRKDSLMKGKKVFYIAMFFAIIFMLFRCEGRDSREYLEDRIGIPISSVYPTKNLKDLFEKFPGGFTIYQAHTEGEYRIKVELIGDPITRMIEGTIKKVRRKDGEVTSQVEVKYQKEEFSFSDEKLATELWGYKRFLFQEMTLNKEVLSKFKLKDTYYNGNNGSFEIEYIVKNEQINEFLGLEKKQQVTLGLHGSNANKKYYYTLSVDVDSDFDFAERIEE